ncbi:putative ribonuclease H protein [Trifolium medium]|uniref:Putative ribonuclease H protein n=1 Tax=Trifolium medium TaxID=97028 RepID=A0A392NES5_9FABA|nr:putative ribonuclease H protein [Trifolium medium]
MFADDLLLFGEATTEQIRCANSIFEKFWRMSGQQFRETNALGKYLGVPLTGRAPRKQDYRCVIEQVCAKLSAWKAKHLSFAGRLTLAKSVLEDVPIYPMMTAVLPKTIKKMHR